MAETVEIEAVVEAIKDATDDYAKILPPDGDWSPLMFLVKDGRMFCGDFPMPPNGPLRDFLFETVLPNQIKPHEPDAVVFLVSTWFVDPLDEEEMEKIQAGEAPMPSERSDRKEAVVIQGVSKEGEAAAFGEIIRSEGHPELDWDTFPMDEAKFKGRLMTAIRRGVWG